MKGVDLSTRRAAIRVRLNEAERFVARVERYLREAGAIE